MTDGAKRLVTEIFEATGHTASAENTEDKPKSKFTLLGNE